MELGCYVRDIKGGMVWTTRSPAKEGSESSPTEIEHSFLRGARDLGKDHRVDMQDHINPRLPPSHVHRMLSPVSYMSHSLCISDLCIAASLDVSFLPTCDPLALSFAAFIRSIMPISQ